LTKAKPEEVLRKHFAALDRHDLDAISETLDPGFEMSSVGVPEESLKGIEAYRGLWGSLFKAFPDLRVKILGMVSEGDNVAVEISRVGTFKEPFGTPPDAIQPTGRRTETRWAAFGRVNSKGLIAEARTYSQGFLEQLGVEE